MRAERESAVARSSQFRIEYSKNTKKAQPKGYATAVRQMGKAFPFPSNGKGIGNLALEKLLFSSIFLMDEEMATEFQFQSCTRESDESTPM